MSFKRIYKLYKKYKAQGYNRAQIKKLINAVFARKPVYGLKQSMKKGDVS